jgi:hypothetical protein
LKGNFDTTGRGIGKHHIFKVVSVEVSDEWMAVLLNSDELWEFIVAFVSAIVEPNNRAAAIGVASHEDP